MFIVWCNWLRRNNNSIRIVIIKRKWCFLTFFECIVKYWVSWYNNVFFICSWWNDLFRQSHQNSFALCLVREKRVFLFLFFFFVWFLFFFFVYLFMTSPACGTGCSCGTGCCGHVSRIAVRRTYLQWRDWHPCSSCACWCLSEQRCCCRGRWCWCWWWTLLV